MSDHPYPQHMPKDSDDPAIKAAWSILDVITPGLLPPLIRFHIAGKIAGAFPDKAVVDAALELYYFLGQMPVGDLHSIEQITPGLSDKLMTFQIAVSKSRKELTR